jgi:hypothetical protein
MIKLKKNKNYELEFTRDKNGKEYDSLDMLIIDKENKHTMMKKYFSYVLKDGKLEGLVYSKTIKHKLDAQDNDYLFKTQHLNVVTTSENGFLKIDEISIAESEFDRSVDFTDLVNSTDGIESIKEEYKVSYKKKMKDGMTVTFGQEANDAYWAHRNKKSKKKVKGLGDWIDTTSRHGSNEFPTYDSVAVEATPDEPLDL